jgi:hypothetical protein
VSGLPVGGWPPSRLSVSHQDGILALKGQLWKAGGSSRRRWAWFLQRELKLSFSVTWKRRHLNRRGSHLVGAGTFPRPLISFGDLLERGHFSVYLMGHHKVRAMGNHSLSTWKEPGVQSQGVALPGHTVGFRARARP